MGYEFYGAAGSKWINQSSWAPLLEIALDFGWKPQGTVIEDHPEWPGHYLGNDGQLVLQTDARSLGEALLRAVEHFRRLTPAAARPEDEIPFDDQVENYDYLVDFAEFAMKGAFEIC